MNQIPLQSPIERVAIVGATGGIGAAFVQHFSQRPETKSIFALGRDPQALADIEAQYEQVRAVPIDLLDEDRMRAAALKVGQEVAGETTQKNTQKAIREFDQRPGNKPGLNLVLVASGFLHGVNNKGASIQPEKALKNLDPQAMQHVLALNALGPLLIAKHFCPLLSRQGFRCFAALSARVGSISDNGLGGWYSYRMAKAALNMGLRNLSIELKRKDPQSLVISLHPGTTDTGLSKPFQSNVPSEKLFSPSFVAQSLTKVIESRTPEDSGQCFDWAGVPIEP